MERRLHRLAAFTLVSAILVFGVLLSPPFKPLREVTGLPPVLEGARFNESVRAADIISGDPGGARAFLARTAHYYHVLFVALVYSMLVLAGEFFPGMIGGEVLDLALAGALMTAVGGLGYAYFVREFYMHGLFIGGLAVVFAAGLRAVWRRPPRGSLESGLYVAAVLLLAGGVLGGYVGSSYMDREIAGEFVEAKIDARYNPDLAEHLDVWRALTGHEHAMIAVAVSAALLVALRAAGLDGERAGRLAWLYTGSMVVMALGSYAVWPLGKEAHMVITPAALLILLAGLLLILRLPRGSVGTLQGALSWGLLLGMLAMWVSEAGLGAVIASSLRKPLVFNPPIRDPAWDWAELAYNIGHWHVLLLSWGTLLLLSSLKLVREDKATIASAWLTVIGSLTATIGATLYMLPTNPQPYTPNPYNNIWVKTLIEPGLTILTLGIIIAYHKHLKHVQQEQRAAMK